MNYTAFEPTGPVFLLIGRRAKVVDPTTPEFVDPESSNLADPANLWLTVNHRTGVVTTEDNASTLGLPSSATFVDRIKGAREFARGSRQKGGR